MRLFARAAATFACASWFALCPAAHALDPERTVPAVGTIEYAFTPGDDAADLVVRTVDAAKVQILVQAFTVTHRGIADALMRAHARGVDVGLIVDQEQAAAFESAALAALVDAGVPVYRDAEHASAHNKVIVVDRGTASPAVVTGSFNFTFAAQNRNAENVIVLRGDPALAEAYFRNWRRHREHSMATVRPRER